jgi:hypothetical protein
MAFARRGFSMSTEQQEQREHRCGLHHRGHSATPNDQNGLRGER